MKKNVILLILVIGFNSFAKDENTLNLKSYFKGYRACFVLYNFQSNAIKMYNDIQCDEQLNPCSTFKIANALIGLETGVLKSPNQVLKWDGKRYFIKAWNKDLTLKEAISVSCVPVFQRIARQIGAKRMKYYLNKFNYGNKDISGGIARFWLGSTLKISAYEQVDFLKRMLSNELELSKSSLIIIQKILEIEKTKNGTLYGKTGTYSGLILGWFVGFVKTKNGKIYIFSTNIKADNNASGKAAKEITIKILTDQKII